MAKKEYDKILTRLIRILKKLSDNERPTTKELADEFNVGVRTIQNDFKKTLSCYPIERDKENRYLFQNGFSLNRAFLDSDEMIVLNLALSQFDDINNMDSIKDRIYKKIVTKSFFNPYYIKQDDLEDIDTESPLIEELEANIEQNEILRVKLPTKTIEIEPYKIANFDGFWYLFAKDLSDEKTKTFKLSELKDIKKIYKRHTTPIKKVESILDKTHSAFYEDGNSFEVIIKVYPEAAIYFENRDFLQSQKIIQEFKDGSLEVSFEVTHD
ncbi:MAG: WYL domain-containing protein, partial [Campylobacterota bacterium]|nr:WYL domain-containing protein [Campylobacterota bacterium]